MKLDPDPEFWPNLDPDPDPGLILSILKGIKLTNINKQFSLKN